MSNAKQIWHIYSTFSENGITGFFAEIRLMYPLYNALWWKLKANFRLKELNELHARSKLMKTNTIWQHIPTPVNQTALAENCAQFIRYAQTG